METTQTQEPDVVSTEPILSEIDNEPIPAVGDTSWADNLVSGIPMPEGTEKEEPENQEEIEAQAEEQPKEQSKEEPEIKGEEKKVQPQVTKKGNKFKEERLLNTKKKLKSEAKEELEKEYQEKLEAKNKEFEELQDRMKSLEETNTTYKSRVEEKDKEYYRSNKAKPNLAGDEEILKHSKGYSGAFSQIPDTVVTSDQEVVRLTPIESVFKDPNARKTLEDITNTYAAARSSGDVESMDRNVLILGSMIGADPHDMGADLKVKLESALKEASPHLTSMYQRVSYLTENSSEEQRKHFDSERQKWETILSDGAADPLIDKVNELYGDPEGVDINVKVHQYSELLSSLRTEVPEPLSNSPEHLQEHREKVMRLNGTLQEVSKAIIKTVFLEDRMESIVEENEELRARVEELSSSTDPNVGVIDEGAESQEITESTKEAWAEKAIENYGKF